MQGHLYWTRELSTLEQRLLGSRSCDYCHTAKPSHAIHNESGALTYACEPCTHHLDAPTH